MWPDGTSSIFWFRNTCGNVKLDLWNRSKQEIAMLHFFWDTLYNSEKKLYYWWKMASLTTLGQWLNHRHFRILTPRMTFETWDIWCPDKKIPNKILSNLRLMKFRNVLHIYSMRGNWFPKVNSHLWAKFNVLSCLKVAFNFSQNIFYERGWFWIIISSSW